MVPSLPHEDEELVGFSVHHDKQWNSEQTGLPTSTHSRCVHVVHSMAERLVHSATSAARGAVRSDRAALPRTAAIDYRYRDFPAKPGSDQGGA